MKKILAVLLVLAMVISVAPAAFAAETQLTIGTSELLYQGISEFKPDQEGPLYWRIVDYYAYDESSNDYSYFNDVDQLDGEWGAIAWGDFVMHIDGVAITASYGVIEYAAAEGGSYETIQFDIKSNCLIALELSYDPIGPGTSVENPLESEASGTVDIPANSTMYYYVIGLGGDNLVMTLSHNNANVSYATRDDDNNYTWHESSIVDGCAVAPDTNIRDGRKVGTVICVVNNGEKLQVELTSVALLGTFGNPAPVELDKEVVTKIEAQESYYYKWTAKNNGILNVAVSGTHGWAYSIGSDNYNSDDESLKPNNTVSVKKGDEVVICVESHWVGTEEEGAFNVTDITLKLSFELATGEKDNPDAIGEDAPGKVTLDNTSGYYYKWTAEQDGKVEISVGGFNGWKYNVSVNGEAGEDHASNDDTVVANQTIEVKKGDVLLVYVSGVEEEEAEITVNLTFTKNVPDNIEINYTQKDKITSADKFNIGEDDWEWVDVEDEVVDKAVLGDDGYYHLNSKDGPILFIDLVANFNEISIKNMNSVGRAKYSILLPEGNYENGQYKAMIDAYLAEVKDGVVALTEELMNMMQKLAVHKDWCAYVESVSEGKVKLNPDDAWMLLCKYAVEQEDDNKDEGNKDNGNVTEPDNKDNSDGKDDNTNKVPETADNSALLESLMIMVIALSGVAVVLTNKKKIA